MTPYSPVETFIQNAFSSVINVTSPIDIIYEEGTTSHTITWTASDAHPDTYVVYKDGIEIDSGNWISGVPMVINVDGLSIGSYNYTIVLWDTFTNSAKDIVIVTVIGRSLDIKLSGEFDYKENEPI